MPLENRTLEPGTVLVARYKGKDRACEVVKTDDGLRYRLDDGTEHRSPSSAGKAAMGGIACNGWRFWSLGGTERPARTPKAAPKKAAKATPKAKAKKAARPARKAARPAKEAKATAHRMRAKEVPSYGCGACGATFGSQKAAVAHALSHTSA